jgi:uncharacterized membrane protein YgdD (TMEM256/DUF423 family)
MSWTIWIIFGGVFGGLGVAFGAFGAHALRESLAADQLAVYETAVRYQMYHAFALLAVGLLAVKIDTTALVVAGIAFVVGTILFSGSLYALTLLGLRWLGIVTPIGGVALLAGWVALTIAALRPA